MFTFELAHYQSISKKRMVFEHITPSPFLAPFVKKYLLLHFKVKQGNISFVKPYPPCPEQCLTFNPRTSLTSINQHTDEVVQRGACYVSGQQVSRLNLHISNDYIMLKVVFWPDAMYQLFGVPLRCITDQYLDTESVIGYEIKTVNEQMANASSYHDIITIAEAYLWQKAKKRKIDASPVAQIGQLLIKDPNRFSLDWLANQACWSPRHLERQFIERMGVSPKFLARISRFDKAFEFKQQNPSLDWLSIALQTGYNDYQHLVKDFKQFAGVTPNLILQAELDSPERRLGLVTKTMATR